MQGALWQVVQKIKASGTQVSVTVLDGNTYEVAKALGRDVGAMLPGIARPLLCYITKDKSSFGFSVSAPEGNGGCGVLPAPPVLQLWPPGCELPRCH